MGPHTHMQTNILKKVSSFVLGHKTSLMKILTEKRGLDAKYGLKMRLAKSMASYLYSRSRPSYKYWKKDTGGERKRPNGAFEKWHT